MIKYFNLKLMNYKKYYYNFYIIILYFLFCGVSYSEPFYFKFSNQQEYISSIKTIRTKIAYDLPNVPGVLALHSNNTYSFIRIISDRSNIIDLVLSNKNLYVVGFVSGGVFYRFNDAEFSNITFPDIITLPMNISSHYTSLSNRAERGRESVIVNQISINEATNTLYRMNGNGTVERDEARAFLTLIIGVSESIRFSHISSFITQNYYGNSEIGMLYSLTNQWGSLSDYAYAMSRNASSNAGYYNSATHATNRNQLYGYLAVANCRTDRRSSHDSKAEEICSSGNNIILLSNNYWPKRTLVSVIM